jgi:O-antigen/teichoic acid export membrane protein
VSTGEADRIDDSSPIAAATGVLNPEEPPAPPAPGGRRGGLAGAAVGTSLANAVLPITSLATGPILARALGPEGRGVMAAVLAPVFVLQFVGNLGLPEAATYAVARLQVPVRRVVFVVGRLALLYGTICALVVLALAPALMHRTPGATTDLRLAICALPFLMLTIILRFTTVGARNFRLSNTERVVSSTARMFGIVGLASLGWLTAPSAVAVNVITTLLGGILLGWVTFRRGGQLRGRRAARQAEAKALRDPGFGSAAAVFPGEPPHLTRTLMNYGFRGAGGVLANLVNWRLDQAVMVVLVDARQLGLYAVAVSLAELPSSVFGQLKNVMFAEAASRDDLSVIARGTRVLILLTGLGAVVGIVTAPVLIRVLFGHAFVDAVGMSQILFVGTIPFSAEQVVASGLLTLGLPGRRSMSQLAAAVVTVVGLFVLTPHMGAMGAAWTSLAAYTTNFAITTALFRRHSGIAARDILFVRPSDIKWLIVQARKLLRKLQRRLRARTGHATG